MESDAPNHQRIKDSPVETANEKKKLSSCKCEIERVTLRKIINAILR